MASVQRLNELNEKRAKLHADMKAVADQYGNTDQWKPEDVQKWEGLEAEYDANLKLLNEESDALTAQANAEQHNREIADRLCSLSEHNSKFDDIANRIGRDGASLSDGLEFRDGGEIKDGPTDGERQMAFAAWALAGRGQSRISDDMRQAAEKCRVNLHDDELIVNLNRGYDSVRAAFMPKNHGWYPQVFNTLTTHTGTSGGFTIGESFVNNLERAMLAFGGMFQTSEIIRTMSADPMRWPTADDTSNTGVQLGESQAVATADPSFAQVVWYAYKFSSKEVKVPYELLRDSAFNLAPVLADMLGERLGRVQNTKYTTGTGAGTAKGIVTAAATGKTTASSTAIAWDEVFDLIHSIDPSRRNLAGVGFQLNDGILKLLRKLKDGNGQYLWNRGANGGMPDMIDVYPYQINQDMASSAASGSATMVFGQLPQYKIRQVGMLRMYRLTERHRENDQDAFLAFIEGDGNLLDAGDNPVKKMVQV